MRRSELPRHSEPGACTRPAPAAGPAHPARDHPNRALRDVNTVRAEAEWAERMTDPRGFLQGEGQARAAHGGSRANGDPDLPDNVHPFPASAGSGREPSQDRPPAPAEGEPALRTRLHEVEGLLELSTLLSVTGEPERILDRIVEGAARCVGAIGGVLVLPEGDELTVRRILLRGRWSERGLRAPVEGTFTGKVYRTGETVVINDLAHDPRAGKFGAGGFGLRRLLAAPVQGIDRRVLAVLLLGDRLDGEPFTERDVALAEAAARHAGVALERVQAQTALAEREAYFRALVHQSHDAVVVLEPGTWRVLDANPRAEALLGRDRDELRAAPRFDPRAPHERDSGPHVGDLITADRPVALMRRRWLRADGSELLVEVSANFVGGPRGRVVLLSARDIGDRVRAETEREHLRAATRERAHEVAVLLAITTALNAAETEDEVVRAVAARAADLCEAEIAGIGLHRDGCLQITHLRDADQYQQRIYPLPPSGSIAGLVLATGRPYVTNDLATDPHTDPVGDAEMGFRSQLAVPVTGADGTVLGIVSLHNKRDGLPFTDHDTALIGALATQAAVALDRVRSKEATARTVHQLRRAHDALDAARRAAERRGDELGVMADVGSMVAAGGALDAVFGAVAERVALMAGFDAVTLNLYDSTIDTVTFDSVYHRLSNPPRSLLDRRGRSLRGMDSPIYRRLLRGSPPIVRHAPRPDDAGGAPSADSLCPAGFGLSVTVPLRYEGRLLGDLGFNAVQGRTVAAEDLRLLEALAGQVAVAVHGVRSVARIKQMREDAVFRLASACEARDPDTGAHLRNIQSLTTTLTRELGLPAEQVEDISLAAMLHDVGKIVVPDAILWKPGKLLAEEFMIVKMHAAQGEAMLAGPEFYATARAIARHHHERFDGSGYPDGRAGGEIPWEARIVAVADVYDALVSTRVYKHAWDPEQAFREILTHAGSHFDPQIVAAFEAAWLRGDLSRA